AKAREARPAAGLVMPNGRVAASGWAVARTLTRSPDHTASPTRATVCRLALMPDALACRSKSAGSLSRIGRHTARTAGSSAAFSAISGPIPAGSPVAMAMTAGPDIPLEPGHQRGVDHIRHALAADRADGEVDVLEPELVRGDQLQREPLRRQLLERQLAGL